MRSSVSCVVLVWQSCHGETALVAEGGDEWRVRWEHDRFHAGIDSRCALRWSEWTKTIVVVGSYTREVYAGPVLHSAVVNGVHVDNAAGVSAVVALLSKVGVEPATVGGERLV